MADDLSIRIGADASQARAEINSFADDADKAMQRVGAAADKATTKLQASLDKLTRSVDPAAAAASRMASGQDTLNKAQAAGLITSDEQQRLMGLLSQKVAETTTRIEMSSREVTSFAKALAEGRLGEAGTAFSRIALGAGALASPLGAAITLVAAFGAAFVKAGMDSEAALNRIKAALVTSGNAAGQTPDSALGLATQLDRNTRLSYRGAEDALTALIGSGKVGPGQLYGAAALVPDLAAGPAGSENSATQMLVSLLADPAKSAKQLADNFNLLDDAQRRHVEDLTAEGRVSQAQQAIIDALSGRFKGLADKTEQMGGIFDRVSKAVSDAWAWAGKIGRPETPDQQIGDLDKQLTQRRGRNGNLVYSSGGDIEGMIQKRIELEYGQYQASRSASDKSVSDAADQLIESATSVAAGFDTVAIRADGVSKNISKFEDALAAELAKPDADPRTVATLRRGLAVAQTVAANPLDPVQAEIARLQSQASIAGAPIGQRGTLSAQASIEQQLAGNLNSGAMTADEANAVAGAQRSASLASLLQPGRDLITNTNEQASAEQALAKAFDEGTAAAERQKITNEAHAAWLKDANVDEKAYAAALLNTARAAGQLTSAEALLSATQQAENAKRIAAAGGTPGAQEAAARLNQALQATQQQRDLAMTPQQAAAAQGMTSQIYGQLTSADASSRDARSAAYDTGQQQRLQELQLELQLMGQTAQARATELADLQTRNQLIAEGYAENTQAFADELAKRTAINEQIAQTDSLIKETEKDNKNWQTTAKQFTDTLAHGLEQGIESGKSLRQTLSAIFKDLANEVLQLGVFNPIENWLSGMLPGAGTTQQPTLFGGGGAPFSALFGGNSPFGSLFGSLLGAGGSSYAGMSGIPLSALEPGGYASGGGGAFAGLGDAASSGGGISDWLSGLFADGGIMTSRGRVPLRRYAGGGIATTAQLAMFGEGSVPEAYVPVPSGKIPVQLNGSGGMNVHMYFEGGVDESRVSQMVEKGIRAAAPGIQAAAVRTARVASVADVYRGARSGGLFAAALAGAG